MSLIEDLKNGHFNFIILIIFTVLIFHLYWTKDVKEPMADAQDSAIEATVKKIYKADIEAIRNLSNISKKLLDGGLTIPGNISVTEEVKAKKLTVTDDTVLNKLCIGGTCINQDHLKLLTGENTFQLKHTNGSWENRMDKRMVHVDQQMKLVKWDNGANFALINITKDNNK